MAKITDFGGLDNQNAPSEYGLKRLEVADNVDITRAGKVVSRKGKVRLSSAVIDAACATTTKILYQSGTDLSLIDDISGGLVVKSGLNVAGWLNATEIADQVFWSNGLDSGVIRAGVNRDLGVPVPIQPSATQIAGALPRGRYLYAITYVRNDGIESGASLSGAIDLTLGGLSVAHPAYIPDGVGQINLYVSTPDGEVLYLAGKFPVGTAIAYTDGLVALQLPLECVGCNVPPPFQASCHYKGRLYYLHGNVLWASLPYQYELVYYSRDYVMLPSDGVMCAAVDDGIYVAVENKTYFLAGNDPQDFVMREVSYGAIFGTAVRIEPMGDRPRGVMWASSRGAVVGFNGGQVSHVTDGVFAYGEAGAGCGAFREQGGQRHFVVSLRGESVPYNARRISILANIEAPLSDADLTVAVGELLTASVEPAQVEILGIG